MYAASAVPGLQVLAGAGGYCEAALKYYKNTASPVLKTLVNCTNIPPVQYFYDTMKKSSEACEFLSKGYIILRP